jgi:hypothetical protein
VTWAQDKVTLRNIELAPENQGSERDMDTTADTSIEEG